MRLIDAEQYRKEFLDSRDFEPMKILDFQPTIQAIPITENATNGDMIKAMFPQIKMREHNKFMFVVEGMAFNHESYSNLFFKDWWNAPYEEKRGNEND